MLRRRPGVYQHTSSIIATITIIIIITIITIIDSQIPQATPRGTSVPKQFLRSWSRIPVAKSPRTHIFCCHRHRQLSSWWHLLCGWSLVACFAFTTSNSARPVLPIDRLPLISERISFFFLPGRKSVEHKPALSPYRLLSFPSLSTAASMTSPKSEQSSKLKQDDFHVFCMRQLQYYFHQLARGL